MTPERFAKLKRVLSARQPDLTVLMENVHKSHNIAAILRTCDAVGVYRANGISDEGEIERHHMVSGGSRKWVDVLLHPDVDTACDRLRASGHQVLAAHFSDQARDYRALDYTRPTVFLLGSELWGVTDRAAALADAHVTIPMEGLVSSLNVSVAAALLLYEARRQREAAGCYERCRLPPADFARTLFEWAHPDIAQRCRERELPYPPLTEEGDLARNPFAG
jgi:tRNA (guanosine-2'-O-)-methyltransferase